MTEAAPEGIRPIAKLFRGDCVALWATTYNVQLSLFNEYLLRRLGDAPLNAVVLADRRRVDETLALIPPERLDTLGPVNRRWLLRGMQVGNGRFHPKSYLSVRARSATLMVGSGNLSSDGIDAGREVFTAFRSGEPAGDAAIATWRSWMRRLVGAAGDTLLAERFADLEQRLPKPEGLAAVVDSPLWHNLDEPLGPGFCAAVAVATDHVYELVATAPFFDEQGEALLSVVGALHPNVVRLYTTSTTSVAGPQLLARLADAGCDVEVFAYEPDRFTHAKLLGVTAGDRGWLLSGSANLSRAALTLPPGPANIELAVFAALPADTLRATFLPPGVDVVRVDLQQLATLTYDTDDAPAEVLPARLHRATITDDGRVQATAVPAPADGWVLADHHRRSDLDFRPGGVATTAEPLDGPLVRLEDPDGAVMSNWAVLEDPEALARALAAAQSGASSRPTELTGADLDTPLGRALLHLHRNLVMDVSEIRSATAGGTGVDANEGDSAGADDLWERLERETLGRDPRAGTYGRMLARRGSADALLDPLVELLDVMRDRAPARTDSTSASVLARLVSDHHDRDPNRPKVTWSTSARIRVRTRNVLRRWAAAQADPRLVWVNPLAPLINLRAVATVFANLYLQAADSAQPFELEDDDLDDLWQRWFLPIVGSERGDGWIDRAGLSDDELVDHVGPNFVELCSALCWLAIRPGADWRERLVHWKAPISAALNRGLLDDTPAASDYVSIITGRAVAPGQLTEDFLHAIEFMDDCLWCKQTAAQLQLDSLDLDAGTAGPDSVKALVSGVADPLHDPRLVRLVVAVRSYRRVDAVAVFAVDDDWRIVIEPDEPAYFLPSLDADDMTSAPLRVEDLDDLASGQRVLADLFPRQSAVA